MNRTLPSSQLATDSLASETVHCPICSAEAVYFGTRRTYRFRRCSACKHLFVWPNLADTLTLYSNDYFSGAEQGFGYVDYDRDKQPMVHTFEQYLDILAELSPGGGSLLDIGAATGFFLDLARKRGWETFGVEPSDYAADIARNKGLRVKTGILEDADFAPGSLDAVTLWDVIEHLPEPSSTIGLIHRILKPGGVAAINTPDSGSLLARSLGLKWHLVVPPEHLNLFNRNSLAALLERQGFEVLRVNAIGKRFTLQYVFQTLAHWSQLGVFESIASRLHSHSVGKAGIPINLFDNMMLCARKRQ
jgi:SAM-dependent methyltransferase